MQKEYYGQIDAFARLIYSKGFELVPTGDLFEELVAEIKEPSDRDWIKANIGLEGFRKTLQDSVENMWRNGEKSKHVG